MKVKIEFTNGSIEVIEAVIVNIYRDAGEVFTVCSNSLHSSKHKLEKVAKVIVDNEIIYDFVSREELYKRGNRE